jgi:hypothetical protein
LHTILYASYGWKLMARILQLFHCQKPTNFKNLICVLFVLQVSIRNRRVWKFRIQFRFLSKKSTFTKSPISLPIQQISPNIKRWNVVHIPHIYHLLLFVYSLQNGGDTEDGVWCKMFMIFLYFFSLLFFTELIFSLIG